MGGEAQGRHLAGLKEVRNVFHLHERHIGIFVFDAWRDCQIDESVIGLGQKAARLGICILAKSNTVSEGIH